MSRPHPPPPSDSRGEKETAIEGAGKEVEPGTLEMEMEEHPPMLFTRLHKSVRFITRRLRRKQRDLA